MKYIVINESGLGDQEVGRAIAAVQAQVRDHVSPWWNVWVELALGSRDDPADGQVFLTSDPLPNGDLGTHGYPDHIPSAKVWTGGPQWTVTLSHEVLEMLVNPRTDRLVRIEHPTAPGFNALVVEEICDPVNDRHYPIDGVQVSDFVLPGWFTPGDEGLPTTYLESEGDAGARIDSLGLSRGGFMLLETMAGKLSTYPSASGLPSWVLPHLRNRGMLGKG